MFVGLKANDLQTLNLSCISDDAQGERLEILWDAESVPTCSMRMDGGIPTQYGAGVGFAVPDRRAEMSHRIGLSDLLKPAARS